ncbi:selenocysteine-tRNA-specific elongation factor [Trypanosoma cruzi]|nr:selenocysteine-tRNA-specific elongation factor [Trypanosoma cruzi]
MMTTESSVPISELRVRLRTQQQRSLRCRLCRIYGRDASTCSARSTARGNCSQRRCPSKTAVGLPAAYWGGGRQPQPFIPPPPTKPHRHRAAPSTLHPIFRIARHNRREGQWSLSANGARLWYDGITDVSALGRLHEESERGGSRDVGAVNAGVGNVSSGAIHNLLPHERTMNEESCAAFLMALLDAAPST